MGSSFFVGFDDSARLSLSECFQMFSEHFFSIFKFIVNISCKLGWFGFVFEPKNKRCYVSSKARVVFKRNFVILSTFLLIWAFLLVNFWFSDSEDVERFALSYILILCTVIALGLASCVLFKDEALARILNCGIIYSLKFEKTWLKKTVNPRLCWTGLILEIAIILLYLTFELTAIAYIGIICIRSDLPIFLINIAPNRFYGLSLALHVISITYAVGASFLCVPLAISLTMMYFALSYGVMVREFNLSILPQKHKAIVPFRFIRNLPGNYREFENLHHTFMEISGLILLPCSFFISHFCLYCNFVLLRDGDKLGALAMSGITVWNLIALYAWCLVLQLGGSFRERSKEALSSWKVCRGQGGTEGERKYLRKFAKGCRPLVLGTEGYFIIRRLSLLKFLRGVVRGTFRMLLTLKN